MKLGARSLSWYIAMLVLRAISAGSKSYGPCGHAYVHIVNSYRLVIDTDGWGLSHAYGCPRISKITFIINRSVLIENANDFFLYVLPLENTQDCVLRLGRTVP